MKRILFLLAITLCFCTNIRAQQGSIIVVNNRNCDIGFDVYATCPNTCESISSRTMWNAPAGKTTTIAASQYQWNAGDGSVPPCTNWEWHWADIWVCGNYYQVGRDVNGCHPAGLSGGLYLPTCDCPSPSVTINFSIQYPGGNVVITIN